MFWLSRAVHYDKVDMKLVLTTKTTDFIDVDRIFWLIFCTCLQLSKMGVLTNISHSILACIRSKNQRWQYSFAGKTPVWKFRGPWFEPRYCQFCFPLYSMLTLESIHEPTRESYSESAILEFGKRCKGRCTNHVNSWLIDLYIA